VYKVADRVKEQTVTTGVGTYNLDGAVLGHRTFVAGVGTTNQCYYTATNGTDWEVGVGTVTDSAPDTLSRDIIYKSSNGDAAVNWGAGIKNIFITPPATYYGGQSRTYIRNVSNTAGAGAQTAVSAGVDTTLQLNGDGTNNFSSANVATGKLEFDATYNSNNGGLLLDNLADDTELDFRATIVNTGAVTSGVAKIFLAFDKANPAVGVNILSVPAEFRQNVEVPIEFSAFHGGVGAVYLRINSDGARTYQVNGLKVVAHEIGAEE
jgi:hypothetical protein